MFTLYIFKEINISMKFPLIGLLLFAVSYCAAQKFKPALNLTTGKTYYMVSKSSSTIAQLLNGQGNGFNTEATYKMAFKVIEAIDTAYNMEVSYQSISLKLQGSGVSVEMDSQKNDPQDIPSTMMAAMTNKPFKITITKKGRITAIENIERMINGVFDNFQQIDTAKRQQVKGQLMKFLGADALKGTIEAETAIFPDKAIAENDKWSVKTSLESPVKTNVLTNYQLTSVAGNYYQVYSEGTMATDKDTKPVLINGLSISYYLSGTTISYITIDKATGWISQVKSKQAMKGTMRIPDDPQVPGGMTIPLTVSTDIVTTDK